MRGINNDRAKMGLAVGLLHGAIHLDECLGRKGKRNVDIEHNLGPRWNGYSCQRVQRESFLGGDGVWRTLEVRFVAAI